MKAWRKFNDCSRVYGISQDRIVFLAPNPIGHQLKQVLVLNLENLLQHTLDVFMDKVASLNMTEFNSTHAKSILCAHDLELEVPVVGLIFAIELSIE